MSFDGDENKAGVIGCAVIGVTGGSSYNIRANISLGGYNHVLRSIQFNSGSAVSSDLISYSGAQEVFTDTGAHINGYDSSFRHLQRQLSNRAKLYIRRHPDRRHHGSLACRVVWCRRRFAYRHRRASKLLDR